MLDIKYINPTGMFSWGKSDNIYLNRCGLVNIVGINKDKNGDSNGSGKTSLFNAISEILFGENPTGVSGDSVINNVMNSGFCSRVEFVSWEGISYRVTYSRKWDEEYYDRDNDNNTSYTGTKIFLDGLHDGKWIDCCGSSMNDTRNIILSAIGMQYKTFVTICYMSNRVGNRFLYGTNKEKMEILSTISNINVWDDVNDRFRHRKKEYIECLEEAQNEIQYRTGAIDQIKSTINMHNIDFLERKKKETLNSIEGCKNRISAINVEISNINNEIALKNEKMLSMYNSDGGINEFQNLINSMNDKIRDAKINLYNNVNVKSEDDVKLLLDTRTKIQSELDVMIGRYNQISENSDNVSSMDTCYVCGSKISSKVLDSLNKKISKLKLDMKSHEDRLVYFNDTINSKKNEIEVKKNKVISDRQGKIKKMEDDVNDIISKYDVVINKYNDETREVNELNNNIKELENEIAYKLSYEIQSLESVVANVSENIEVINNINSDLVVKEYELEQSLIRRNDIAGELELVEWFISNIPYIKLHKLYFVMNMLSDEMNKCLMEMNDTIRVSIHSFEEKKSVKGAADHKDMLKSDIDIRVCDGNKDVNIKCYSDGEMSRITNAFVRSINEIARKNGLGCNIMMLDEVFSFVDKHNCHNISESINNMSRDKLVMITDNTGMANSVIDFDETWNVCKSGGITRLEVK